MQGREQIIIEAIESSPLNCGLSGADWLAFAGNISIVKDHDVTLFDDEGGAAYQIHILYQSSGRKAIGRAKDAFCEMFQKHHAGLIFGMVPVFQKHVKLIARWAGMKSVGIRATPEGPCELFVLSREMWKGSICRS